MAEKEVNVSGGIGFWSLLGIVFIILKLTNVIAWSWLWVLSPFWIGVVFIVLMIIIYIIVMAVMITIETKKKKNERKTF